MGFILEKIEEAIKELLIGWIESNMTNMFTDVNDKVGTIAAEVGKTDVYKRQGDGLLRRFADFLCLLVLFLLHDQLLLFLGGEKIAVHLAVFGKPLRLCGLFRAAVQSAIPPSL